MSDIDDVIDRARQPGGFSEQKQFSVARERAIRKMREFALADPHFYILELIQAAVANDADHVHIDVSSSTLQFSYIGGGYTREELAQLFDFLFASKKDFDHSDIRQLALGINALMIMEPSRIVVESGDGTMQSTDRIEIREDENTVEVGTPEEPLRGTFVRAEGLNRSVVRDKSNLSERSYGPAECTAIERRCLAAPVPIIVNDEPVFGYTSQRTPVIFGYDDVVTFDEGDLYGSIGIPAHRHKRSFKVMTWGVWIESTDGALMDDTPIGGVVCYDRLNKTADHSGIVRDEQFEEMWARVRPYARQAAEGKAGQGSYRVRHLSGAEIPPRNLRKFFRQDETFVVVDRDFEPDDPHGKRAGRIGELLDAPVLCVGEDAFDSVDVLSGPDTELLQPNLENAPEDLDFYRSEPAPPPPRPWLTGALPLTPLDIEELASKIHADEPIDDSQRRQLVDSLGTRTTIDGTIFTPREAEQTEELYVRAKTLDRIIWEGPVRSPFPGHVLELDLPAVPPSSLLREATSDATYAELLARTAARMRLDQLREATQRALDNLTMSDRDAPSETEERIALAALARSTLKRLRNKSGSEESPAIHFSLIGPRAEPDLLDLPVFEALDGSRYSLSELESLMNETAGLVYGVVPEVEPALEGLDTSRILDLDLERERQLLTIVGEAAYVRVDRRDVLAESDQLQVRDLAVGLRSFPNFPFLVEGADPASLDDARREDVVADLVAQLKQTFFDETVESARRRNAVRHLQWFVCRRIRASDDAPTYGVEALPLFLDGRGRPTSFEKVHRGLQSPPGLEMIDGRSSDVSELGSLFAEAENSSDPARRLTMNTWLFRLLSDHGPIRTAFDFDFSDREVEQIESTPPEAFLEYRELEGDGFSGRVGIPLDPPERPSVAVVDPDRTRAHRMDPSPVGRDLIGFIFLESGDVERRWDELHSELSKTSANILGSLLDDVPGLDSNSERFNRSLEVLFDFAARKLQLARHPDGSVAAHIDNPFAEKILELPLVPSDSGNPVSVRRLVEKFCLASSSASPDAPFQPDSRLPDPLSEWLDRHLTPANVVAPSDRPVPSDPPPSDSLEKRLSFWLRRLRPDDHPTLLAARNSETTGSSPTPAHPETRLVQPDELPLIQFDSDSPCRYVGGEAHVLFVDAEHPLVRRATDSDDPVQFAWLLLTCYAHINDLLEPVTNDHELEFQRRIAENLESL